MAKQRSAKAEAGGTLPTHDPRQCDDTSPAVERCSARAEAGGILPTQEPGGALRGRGKSARPLKFARVATCRSLI